MKKSLLSITLFFAISSMVIAQDNSGETKGGVKAGFGLTVVQEQAEFPGGNDSLQAFLRRNLVFPEKARKEKVSGKVYISFNVTDNGKITDAKVLSGVSPELDNEALRVVNQMPPWKPGTISGKPVKVQYILPIDFIIPTGKSK
ncbi:MAG: energy transducer TonB [Bacteroidetes bacterium]|nr:energy transducer TonB [Bacteroidota bacterium]